jgi:Cation transporter/ATPase, N-terminus
MTTCPVVCVADVADCPTSCRDNSKSINTMLCISGSCEETCSEFNYRDDANPCTCESLPIACPKVEDYYDECFAEFQSFYDNNTQCLDSQSDLTTKVSFTGQYFLFCYGWMACVTALVVGWCYFNEVLFPDPSGTTMSFRIPESSTAWGRTRKYDETATQTGYKRTLIGTGIYVLVVATSVGFQLLLLLTTILYYIQQGAITRWPPFFEDEAQSLKAFVLTWMIGFPWTLSFRYIRSGTHTLFLRRCRLSEASHVAVFSRIKENEGLGPKCKQRLAQLLWAPMDRALAFAFSYPYAEIGKELCFRKVHEDPRAPVLAIYHDMRRYVFDKSRRAFEPVQVHIGTTLGDFVSNGTGLSTAEAIKRRGTVGPNAMNVDRPTVLSSLYKEFSKAF